MRLKPNDIEMELGEVRRVTFNLAGAVGTNTITDVELSSPRLTFGTPSISGASVSVLVTAAQCGTHAIIVTAELSSSETVKAPLRAKVVDSSLESGGRVYD